MGFLVVFVGSGIGGAFRYGVGVVAVRLFGLSFPIGTLFINVIGSFAMAAVVEYFAPRGGMGGAWKLFFTTGIIGGFTTFSTFSLDAVTLYERGQFGLAALYVIASVAVSLAAFFLALWLLRSLLTGS